MPDNPIIGVFNPYAEAGIRNIALKRFAEAVFGGSPVDIPGEEGRKDLEVLLAAYRAGETNRPVVLPI